jgi:hypothetical protein
MNGSNSVIIEVSLNGDLIVVEIGRKKQNIEITGTTKEEVIDKASTFLSVRNMSILKAMLDKLVIPD